LDGNDEKKVRELREELIGKVRDAMKRVFGNLILKDIADPFSEGSFYFEKGSEKSFHYRNLSGGEKAAFDLLLDFTIKLPHYNNTVFCIDEPELQMHTALQGKLVEELFNNISDDSQLWVTTHSLGVILTAKELSSKYLGQICILDFADLDFDEPCSLVPARIDKLLWEKFLSITVGSEISQRIAPQKVFLCEGSLDGKRRKNFDADIYNIIFSSKCDALFISGGSSEDLKKQENLGYAMLSHILRSATIKRVVDRDDSSDEEVEDLEKSDVLVLKRRHLESYLFDDEILVKLARECEASEEEQKQVLKIKADAIQDAVKRGHPQDHIKSAKGPIYNELKKLLKLTRRGNNADQFMKDTLAKLVTQETNVYKELEEELFNSE
jgi:hypothetical protein